MNTDRDLFRFCACCPSPCRSAIPASDPVQSQSTNPSSLSMIALAVIDGMLEFNESTKNALLQTDHSRMCFKACPHQHDIATAITHFVSKYDHNDAQKA